MRRFLAARVGFAAACWLLVVTVVVRSAGAQTWNDPRSRAIVEGATQRRAEQLADTALRDYQATAHGYVTFLAQMGEGFRTPPKIIKSDELELEVYWRAPNLSKQRVIGRRDTLLLPTDIAYHADHLGIVQNNFPNVIRIGEGDEIADVPHPLSPIGLAEYDFALSDSFSIGSAAQRIRVYEVKVRPRDDTKARVIGAVYIEPESRQVVRMNLTFTAAAFLDKSLDELSLVLENRLVGGRFWLPSRQQIEIVRRGEWLDFPARGIISGRWEIGEYKFNQSLAPTIFAGQEYTQAPASVLAQYHWTGAILDSLPEDVRAPTEPDIQRVQDEARQLVHARALAASRQAKISVRNVSDFARVNRVEGLSLGGGLAQPLGGGFTSAAQLRYGLDDKMLEGRVDVGVALPNGDVVHLFALRDFRELGDVDERSRLLNSLAAQEFGSDYTDPYLVRAVGARVELTPLFDFDTRLSGWYERESPLGVHAVPVTGRYEPTALVESEHALRLAIDGTRPPMPWVYGTELTAHVEARARWPSANERVGLPGIDSSGPQNTLRGAVQLGVERSFGETRLVTALTAAGVHAFSNSGESPVSERVYLGGPTSAPGYDFHSLVSTSAYTAHLEWQIPAPFPAFSLGRYGRVPARGAFAPYVHVAELSGAQGVCGRIDVPTAGVGTTCQPQLRGVFPSIGAGYLTPFNVLRLDVARGTGRNGRWYFYVDISRDFWSIL
jgi:hypothetical protein